MMTKTKARELFGEVRGEWKVIQEFTRSVVNGYHNGFYLWGVGGIGKSYQVEQICKRLAPDRLIHRNTRMTAAGFFDLLTKFPDGLFVIEDVETVFDDKKSWGLLRSALWGQKDRNGVEQRLVSWTIADNEHRSGSRQVNFTGQIIIVANTRLGNQPEIVALADRIPTFELCLTGEQVKAAMIVLSQKEWRHGNKVVSPEECGEVTEFLLAEIDKQEMRVSLRLRELALKPFLAWREKDTRMDWKDVVRVLVEQTAARQEVDRIDPKKVGIKERMLLQEQVLVEIFSETPNWAERVALWIERTGASQRTMYRRMQAIGL